MTLNQLYYFQTLANELHYRIASEKLNIAQPTLSYSIQELENELGSKLFLKRGRNIILSNEGKKFLNYVNESLAKLEEGIDAIAFHHEIEISIIPTLIPKFVKFLTYYNDIRPEITVHIHSEKTSHIINGIKNGIYDLGVCSYSPSEGLKGVPVSREELVVIVPSSHRLANRESISLKELNNESFYCYRKNLELYKLVNQTLNEYNVKVNELEYLDDEISLVSMVGAGLGVAIVANNHSLDSGDNYKKLKIEEKYHPREIFAVYNPDDINDTALHFLKTMVEFSGNKYK